MPSPEYLEDPEEQSENAGQVFAEPVKAVTKDDAKEVCQDKADEYNVELVGVEHRGQTWWDCIFSSRQ